MTTIPARPGLYFVRLRGEELVSVNDNDPKRRDRCIKVNSANAKYGKATTNLRSRFAAYRRTFGASRVRFDVLMLHDDPSLIERDLHIHFLLYRMRGSTGRSNEWLENIDPDMAFIEATRICSCGSEPMSSVRKDAAIAPQTLPTGLKLSSRVLLPEDVVRSAEYLQRNGMSEQLLSELHHFGRQTYKQTLDHFRGKTRIQGRNPVYAARLEFVVRGHIGGGGFADLIDQAKAAFPFPETVGTWSAA
jgi:hypothetical protein